MKTRTESAIFALRKLGQHGIAKTIEFVVRTPFITDKQLIDYGASNLIHKIKKIASTHKITTIHQIES